MATNPAIPYYGYYFGNTLQEDPAQSQTAQQFLTALRQYDPTAYFQQGTQGGSDGSVPTWTIQYDASKLPGGGAQNVDLNPNDYSPLYGEATGHGIQGTVNNPSGVTTDPVYGKTTPTSNFTFPKDSNLDDILGPLLVASFGFGAPFLASAMSGGALGGSAGGLLAEQAAAPIVDGTSDGIAGVGADGLDGSAFGMADRGLGVAGGAGSDGTLSASDISALQDGTGFGMNDRGLGTTANGGLGSGTDGTLTASQIADLSPGLLSGISPSQILSGLSKIPGILSKIPGLGGSAGGSGGGGAGGAGGLLNMPPSQYGSLAGLLKRYYGGTNG